MEEESVNYGSSEFLKSNRNFLKDYCFKFEGLSSECERGFTHIIKDLGGRISKNAKYTLVEQSYFDKGENKNRKDLYHLNFILDSLDFKKLLDIELYRCNKTDNKINEKSPSLFQNKSINDNNSNIGKIIVRNFSNDLNSNDHADDEVPLPEMITQSESQIGDKQLAKHTSEVKKCNPCNDIRSNNGIINNTVRNDLSNESNSDDDIPKSKKVKQSKLQDNGKILKKNISKVRKRKLSNTDGSDSESSSSDEPVKVKIEQRSSDSSEDESDSTSNTLNKSKKISIKAEVPSSSEDTNYEDSDSEATVTKRRKKESDVVLQAQLPKSVLSNKTKSTVTKKTWVDTKDMEKNKDNKESASPESGIHWKKTEIEKRADLKWLFDVDMSDLCTIRGCNFEPGPHERHSFHGRIISDEEKKVILKYLIKNNLINRAKGIRTWENMISEGYLAHRSADTLRNCLRRVMLPCICKFNLPVDILDQFLALDEKKAKGKKIW